MLMILMLPRSDSSIKNVNDNDVAALRWSILTGLSPILIF